MEIVATSIYKRFYRNWILKDFNYTFHNGRVYGIAGSNGSGKSTLLQLLSGMMSPSKGKILYKFEGKELEEELWFSKISYAAPYADVYDYMNVKELFHHQHQFKKFRNSISCNQFIEICYLEGHEDKLIKYYSSGMKQRLKLALAILADSKVLFLDEPISNLDDRAKIWCKQLIKEHCLDRLVIIASNEPEDFELVQEKIQLTTHKIAS
ncbi:MAG: ATP-binding cassette domain-containing protein [Saprospiraceae bacterium]|nr:ATP-binding cassette domain-containing protein [Saprospiraceae bacterium]HRG67849.1 ATP-binding cassette domain-containing protein [Saprospiraceae bacterium]